MSYGPLAQNVALVGYAVASLLHLLALQKKEWRPPIGKAAVSAFVLATVSASAALLTPGAGGIGGLASVLLAAAIGWLSLFAHWRFGMRLIGAFVAPLSTLILLLQSFASPGQLAAGGGGLPWLLQTHVALAILGQAFAIIACAISVLFLWQQNLLRKKLLDQLPQSLPSIDRLEFLLMAALWSGFVFITFGLLTGALFVQMDTAVKAAFGGLSAKVIWATAVWVWYLATLLARNVFDRPAKRIAQMSLAGFLLLALTLFGTTFFGGWGGA